MLSKTWGSSISARSSNAGRMLMISNFPRFYYLAEAKNRVAGSNRNLFIDQGEKHNGLSHALHKDG
jgi:hypothetical protein